LKYYSIMQEIAKHAELSRKNVVEFSIHRYLLFLRLQQKHVDSWLYPPLDVQAVWLAHLIRNNVYIKDCIRLFGSIVPCHLLTAEFDSKANLKHTEELWKAEYKEETFLRKKPLQVSPAPKPLTTTVSICADDVVQDRNWLDELERQVGNNRINDRKYLIQLIEGYEMLLYLHAKHPKSSTTPPIPIDLIWHAHQCHPVAYQWDMKNLLGRADGLRHAPRNLLYGSALLFDDFQNEFAITLNQVCEGGALLHEIKAQRSITARMCSFLVTNKQCAQQQCYTCKSCNQIDCCSLCATVCHAGHDVQLQEGKKSFWCTCGARGDAEKCRGLVRASAQQLHEAMILMRKQFPKLIVRRGGGGALQCRKCF